MGLGLAIIRSLVTLHGGAVEALSEGLGRGSEFIVRLPADVSRAIGDRDTPVPAGVAGRLVPASGPATRILVVDDNVDAADLLAEALALMGHTTRVAYDEPSALDAAGTFAPDLALLDIGLPVMDGYELAQHLKGAPDLASIHLVTGYGQDLDRRRSKAAGFDEHLVKPIHVDRVAAIIARLPNTPDAGS